MNIHEQQQGAVVVVRPVGALAGADAERLLAHLRELRGRTLGRFVVDAAGVPFADSRGLEVLAELAEELGASGQALRLAGLSETLREVLELTELADRFEHYEDVPTAVRSFL